MIAEACVAAFPDVAVVFDVPVPDGAKSKVYPLDGLQEVCSRRLIGVDRTRVTDVCEDGFTADYEIGTGAPVRELSTLSGDIIREFPTLDFTIDTVKDRKDPEFGQSRLRITGVFHQAPPG